MNQTTGQQAFPNRHRRIFNSPLIKFINFQDGNHINLIEIKPPYEDGTKYAMHDTEGQSKTFKRLSAAEARFDELADSREAQKPARSKGITGNYPNSKPEQINNTDKVIQHTKGKWEAKKITYSQIVVGIKNYGTENNYRDDNHCGQIAVITGWDGDKRAKLSSEDESNAARIVKCVNSHDALIENLKRLIDRIEENEIQSQFPSAYRRAKEALKNAE